MLNPPKKTGTVPFNEDPSNIVVVDAKVCCCTKGTLPRVMLTIALLHTQCVHFECIVPHQQEQPFKLLEGQLQLQQHRAQFDLIQHSSYMQFHQRMRSGQYDQTFGHITIVDLVNPVSKQLHHSIYYIALIEDLSQIVRDRPRVLTGSI